jgi:hypothetical protein
MPSVRLQVRDGRHFRQMANACALSWQPYRRPEDNDHMMDGIQKAGWRG